MKRFVFVMMVMLVASTIPAAADFQAGLAAYGRGDYAAALREWRPLAKHGNADAQYRIGFMYDKGKGGHRDYAKAFKWYLKAAGQGVPSAQNKLGIMYYKGHGIDRDYEQAAYWFRKAADQKMDQTQAMLGFMFYNNVRGAAKHALAH